MARSQKRRLRKATHAFCTLYPEEYKRAKNRVSILAFLRRKEAGISVSSEHYNGPVDRTPIIRYKSHLSYAQNIERYGHA